jgi:hypothetical protein
MPTIRKQYRPLECFRFLSDDGTTTGEKNIVGDYSSASETFYVQADIGTFFVLSRIIVSIEDSGSFDSGRYGNGGTLTNGIQIKVSRPNSTDSDLTDGLPVFTNGQWAKLCHDVDLKNFGAGNEWLTVRWTLKHCGIPIVLNGDENEALQVIVNDDFTHLISHRFMVQGFVMRDDSFKWYV